MHVSNDNGPFEDLVLDLGLETKSGNPEGGRASPSASEIHGVMPRYLTYGQVNNLITPAQELFLAHACRKGDKEAKRTLIEGNLRLVVSIAKNFKGRGLDLEDLIAEGNLGLMQAIERFDPDKGYKLSTYATPWIRKAISRAIENCSRSIRIPVYQQEILGRIRKAQSELTNELAREPTTEEISKRVDCPSSNVQELLLAGLPILSLDSPVTDTGGTIGDILAVETQDQGMLTSISSSQSVNEIIAALPNNMKAVIEMRYGLGGRSPMKFKEIAQETGLSPTYVRKLNEQALRVLNNSLTRDLYSN